jgi:FMN phosphatase YigB (HAD superfamily)
VQPPLVLFDVDNTLADRRGTLAGWAVNFDRNGPESCGGVHAMLRAITLYTASSLDQY